MAKVLKGKVISIKMEKTVVVEVTTKKPHPLYKKLINRSKKFKADTNGKTVKINDMVTIKEVKPMGSEKHFLIEEVLA